MLAVAEGAKEDKASWTTFLRHLKERGLKGVRLFVSDKCLGLVESLGEFYPEALWQRCAVHFYRNVWTAVPTSKMTPSPKPRVKIVVSRPVSAKESPNSLRTSGASTGKRYRSAAISIYATSSTPNITAACPRCWMFTSLVVAGS